MSEWEPVIGLEVHVQLATSSKLFSPSAVSFGHPPNSLTDPTVLGLPGALPTCNRQAIAHAVKLGLATGCRIRDRSRFARKQYFYPDLPKGYQISQYDEPLCEAGAIEMWWQGGLHRVRLIRIHLEEDAGKSTHGDGKTSLVDLNRAGVPLCEVVSEPDLRTAAEAAEYMRALRQLVRYLGISDGDMEKGQLRCDANVSLRRRGASEYGTRTELKNINSFKFVEAAIEHEIIRQARILDGGGHIVQETRLWDADRGISQAMRSKEEAEDYRYFPDPDLPALVIDDSLRHDVATTIPELPMVKMQRYVGELGLADDDARTLAAERELAEYFDEVVVSAGVSNARLTANWIQSELLRELNREGQSVGKCNVTPDALGELVGLIADGTISGKIAKKVFAEMYANGGSARRIVDREGLEQITDTGAIEAVCAQVVAANPAQAEQFRAGKENLLGYFVGRVMKETRGQANPQAVNEILRRLLQTG